MKKIMVLWGVLFAVAVGAMASPVDVNRARRVGSAFLSANYHRTVDDLKVVETPYSGFYVFNAPSGFVMVAANDCVRPILGYSLTHTFLVDGMPSNLRSWLDGCERTLAELTGGKTGEEKQGSSTGHTNKDVATEWQQLLGGVAPQPVLNTAVSPLLTTTWNQRPLYNDMCPYDSVFGQNAVTGCVATATAQIMKYWNHPATGYGSHSYVAQNSHISYGVLWANFGNTSYDWSNMPNALTSVSSPTEIDAVALLMYHVGVAVEMRYNVGFEGGSSSYNHSYYYPSAMSALVDYFKYAPDIAVVSPGCYDATTYSALLRAELDQQRPILYDGRDPSGGHSFVCDGYDDNNMFHFNWGWGGNCDGYYAIGALNPAPGGTGGNATYTFNISNSAMLGIRPNTSFGTGGTVTVSTIDGAAGCSASGAGTYNFGDTVTVMATAAEGYRFAGWTDNSQENPRVFTMTGGDYSFTARFEPIGSDTMSYCGNLSQHSYWGESDLGVDKYWGIKLPASSLATGRTLSAVEFYVGNSYYAGTFDMTVYSGTTAPTDTVYSATVTTGSTDINSWYSIFLSTPYAVEAGKSIWITLRNSDIQYPATITNSSGNPDGFLYGPEFDPDPDWIYYSFMIRGRFDNPGTVVDGDTISYCGDKGYQTSWGVREWGIMLPAAELQGRNYLKSVMMFADFDGVFTLHIHKGGATAPGTLVHSQPARIEGHGWHEIVLDNTVAIDAGDSLWITFENYELRWPATSCRYTGNPNSNWFVTGEGNWNHLNSIFSDGNFSWMIKAVTSATAPTLPPPTVVMSGSQVVTVGNTAVFSAVHSMGTTVEWTFQGGTPATATGDMVNVVWNQTGWYQVTATVSNSNGTTTDEMMVSVGDCDSIVLPYTADFTQCWTTEGGATIIDGNHVSLTSNGQRIVSPWLESLPGRTFLAFCGEVEENYNWNSDAYFTITIEDENGIISNLSYTVQNLNARPSIISPGGRIRVAFEYTGSIATPSFQITDVAVYQYQIDVAQDVPGIATVGDTVTLTFNATLQNGDTPDDLYAWMYGMPNWSPYYSLLPYYDSESADITVLSQTENSVTLVYNTPGRYKVCSQVLKYEVYNDLWAWADVNQDILVTARPAYTEDSIYYTSAAKDTVIGCHPQLHTANIAAEARVIRDSAFCELGNLVAVNMPDGLKYIGDGAFTSVQGLREITIPRDVEYVGGFAFAWCSELTTINYNADSCLLACPPYSSNGYYYPVFYGCYNVTTINIGENVTRIPDRIFSYCEGLRDTLVIPDNVTYIGENAFYSWVEGGPELTLVLGRSVSTIGNYAFPGYYGRVHYVISLNPVPPTLQSASFYTQPNYSLATVPCGSRQAYLNSAYWDEFIIEEDCSAIEDVDDVDMPQINTVSHGIIVAGADGEQVRVYDVIGRLVATSVASGKIINVPQTGVYMVQIGDRPARKVVVVR